MAGGHNLLGIPIQPGETDLDRAALVGRGDVGREPFEDIRSRLPVTAVLKSFAQRHTNVKGVGRDCDGRLNPRRQLGEKAVRDVA
jgi:hypothetical protein